jgi:hypothetical protein
MVSNPIAQFADAIQPTRNIRAPLGQQEKPDDRERHDG